MANQKSKPIRQLINNIPKNVKIQIAMRQAVESDKKHNKDDTISHVQHYLAKGYTMAQLRALGYSQEIIARAEKKKRPWV
jgi:hypothetical protein